MKTQLYLWHLLSVLAKKPQTPKPKPEPKQNPQTRHTFFYQLLWGVGRVGVGKRMEDVFFLFGNLAFCVTWGGNAHCRGTEKSEQEHVICIAE